MNFLASNSMIILSPCTQSNISLSNTTGVGAAVTCAFVGSGLAGTGVGEIVFSVPARSATKVVKECIMLLLACLLVAVASMMNESM